MPDKGYDIEPITEYLVDTGYALNSKPDCSVTPTK